MPQNALYTNVYIAGIMHTVCCCGCLQGLNGKIAELRAELQAALAAAKHE